MVADAGRIAGGVMGVPAAPALKRRGITLGCHVLMPSCKLAERPGSMPMEKDRRSQPNQPLTEAVDATVELMPNINRRQAALVMARDGVPPRVIRRIIDEPEHRRATDKDDDLT